MIRKSLRHRLRIERLETRTLMAADIAVAEIQLFAEPIEAAEASVPAEVDLSLVESDFVEVATDSQVDLSLEPAAIDAEEPIVSDFLAPTQQVDLASTDQILQNDSEFEELFDANRLIIDVHNPERQILRPVSIQVIGSEKTPEVEQEPSQTDNLESFGDDQDEDLVPDWQVSLAS